MGFIIYPFLSGLLIICDGLHVSGPSGPVIAELGGSAMLPCYVKAPIPLEELEVEWKRTDSETLVHLFQDGESQAEVQDQAYSGRASFFTGEVERGNFSLLLTNLTTKDAGVYRCSVHGQHKNGQTSVKIEYLVVTGGGAVSSYAREDVTLNCSVDSRIPPKKLDEVSWTKVDQDITVLVFQQGAVQSDFTHQRFRDRVEFFSDEEILRGNFSLRIKDLRMEDKGLYRCDVLSGELSASATVEVDLRLRVLGPSGPLIVQLGGSVMLPCYVKAPIPLEELEVEWRRTDNETSVHLFQEGESRPEAQNEVYSGRASFFTGEVERGNFSLLLTNLTIKDAGVYNCSVYRQQDSGQTSVDIKYLIVTGGRAVSPYAREDTTLNCSVDSRIPPKDFKEVSWTKVDKNITLLVFQAGVIQTDFTHQRFTDRVEFFGLEEIHKGNFSLRIKDLQLEDKGLYRCDVFSGELSANATVEMLQLGFSHIHIVILVLCGLTCFCGSLLFFGCIPYTICKGPGSYTVIIQNILVFFPNIFMFVAFILWGVVQGFVSEAATCLIINLLRILRLLLLSECVYEQKDKTQRFIKALLLLEYLVLSVIAALVLGLHGWQTQNEGWIGYAGCMLVLNILSFSVAVLVFLARCLHCKLKHILNRELKCKLKKKLKRILNHVPGVLHGLTSFIALLMFFLTSEVLEANGNAGVILLVIYSMSILILVFSITEFYDLDGLKKPPEPITKLFVLGAAVLLIVNSITLAVVLISQAGKGERAVGDLRLILIPFEMAFVLICSFAFGLKYDRRGRKRDKPNHPCPNTGQSNTGQSNTGQSSPEEIKCSVIQHGQACYYV